MSSAFLPIQDTLSKVFISSTAIKNSTEGSPANTSERYPGKKSQKSFPFKLLLGHLHSENRWDFGFLVFKGLI